MNNYNHTEPRQTNQTASSISTEALRRESDRYLLEQECGGQSTHTTDQKRVFMRMLLRFLEMNGHRDVGREQMLLFFHHLRHGHKSPEGRFGIERLKKPPKDNTIRAYHIAFTVIFEWLVSRNILPVSPMAGIPRQKEIKTQKPPLQADVLETLIAMATASRAPERNRAILGVLLDTGCRSKEILGLRTSHIDLRHRQAQVFRKGGDEDTVFFSEMTAQLISTYLHLSDRLAPDGQALGDTPLWRSRDSDKALTKSGLQQMLKRLKEKGGIRPTQSCSPHCFRRTFAVYASRGGWNTFTLQKALGHTDLQMTRHYTQLANTDVETALQHYSPVQQSGLFGDLATMQTTSSSPPKGTGPADENTSSPPFRFADE